MRCPGHKFKVAGAGELLWDRLPAGRQPGGAPANFAYHAGALGAQAMVVSAVGADADGAALRAAIRALGLDDTGVSADPAHPTGVVDVTLDAAGKPAYCIAPDRAWDHWQLTPALADMAAGLDAICFGTLGQRHPTARAAIRGLVHATAPACLRVFDVNLRGRFFDRSVIHASLQMANVLKVSDEELPVAARLLDLPDALEAQLAGLFARYPLQMLVLTRGARGSLLLDRAGRDEHPGAPAVVADTVGAGDAFAAAVVMGRLRGWALPEINRHANRLAAYVCACHGATPPHPRGSLK